MKGYTGTCREEGKTLAAWTFCPLCSLTMPETFSRRPQINVSPLLICCAIFWKPDSSASQFMGSMCHGYSASVSVITRTSLQDTAGRSLQPAALSSVSVAITAKCLWLHSSSPSRGVRPEMYHPVHAPVPLLLCSRCQRGVTQGGVCLGPCPCPCKNRFELQTIGGRSVWRTGPLYGAVTRARLFCWKAQGQKLAVWAMLAPAFHQSPMAQESTLCLDLLGAT